MKLPQISNELQANGGLKDILLNTFYFHNEGKSVRLRSIKNIWIPFKNIDKFVDSLEATGYTFFHRERSFLAFNDTSFIVFENGSHGLHDGFIYYTANIDFLMKTIGDSANHGKRLEINWYTSTDMDYEFIVDTSNYVTRDSIYPFVKGGVDKYISDFLDSDASIIILIGEPGTGKTNFIRSILYAIDQLVYLTFNEGLLKSDAMFAQFIADQAVGSLVVEDADLLLKSRAGGNDSMSKFLNVGDGLIKLNGKKLIFSTNLESINDIDQAIMRPGRCHDVLKFRKLTLDEANIVCKDYKLDPLTEKKSYTLAEIFNRQTKAVERQFGFI